MYFNEISQFPSLIRSFSQLLEVNIFSLIPTFFLPNLYIRISHVPEIWPIQTLLFNIIFQTCWLCLFSRTLSSTFILWKIRGHAVVVETLKYLQALRMSPRFSLTSFMFVLSTTVFIHHCAVDQMKLNVYNVCSCQKGENNLYLPILQLFLLVYFWFLLFLADW